MVAESGGGLLMGQPPEAGSLSVVVENRQQDLTVDADRWSTLLVLALQHEGVTMPAEVGLAFIDADEMTMLNTQHMDGVGPTDVLSFPVDGLDHRELASVAKGTGIGEAPVIVGDVVVAPVVAAKVVGPTRTLEDELALLIVHGALHLIGHDHFDENERELMQSREQDLLDRFYRSTP